MSQKQAKRIRTLEVRMAELERQILGPPARKGTGNLKQWLKRLYRAFF